MFITVINDCKSPGDVSRQETRINSLFGLPISFMGVSSDFSVNATLQAAGGLIDVLDAAEERDGVVLVNVAPRGEAKKDGYNGTSFCYFNYKNVLVISTIRGSTLSLIKKLDLVQEINLVSVDEVIKYAYSHGMIGKLEADYIPTSQFRSFDFTPRLAYWLHTGHQLPSKKLSIEEIDAIPNCIWYQDDFGNLKTTLLESDMPVKIGEKVQTSFGDFNFLKRLKDLQKGETAFYLGSSGIQNRRFVEIATQMQKGSAAATLGLSVGSAITFT